MSIASNVSHFRAASHVPAVGPSPVITKYLGDSTPNAYGALLCNFYAKCRESLSTEAAFGMAYQAITSMIGDTSLPLPEARELTSAFEHDELDVKRCLSCKIMFIDMRHPDFAQSLCLNHR